MEYMTSVSYTHLTENNDLATEYEYRHEGVNDYITAPVNIPELIRQVLFFVE